MSKIVTGKFNSPDTDQLRAPRPTTDYPLQTKCMCMNALSPVADSVTLRVVEAINLRKDAANRVPLVRSRLTRRQFLHGAAATGIGLVASRLALGEVRLDAADDDITIVAHYFPWYTSGAWDHNFVHTPLLGTYDSSNPEVINKHIDWAAEYGIDAFAIAWNGCQSWTDGNIRNNILTADLIDNIGFFLTYDQGSWINELSHVNLDRGSEDRRKLMADIEYFNETYFTHPSYVSVNGKKPIFLFGSKVIEGDLRGALNDMREISADYGNELYIIGDELDLALRSNEVWVKQRITDMQVFDAVSAYTLLYNDYSGGYQQFVRDHRELYSKLRWQIPTDLIPYAQAGNNDRRIRPEAKNPILERDADTFASFCKVAKQLADSAVNMVFITSFNEWHEDTQIEPAEAYGFDYLEVVRDVLAGDQ